MTLVIAEVTLKPALFPVVITLPFCTWAPLLTLRAEMDENWLVPLPRNRANGPLLSEMADYVANRELLRLFTMKLLMPCGLSLALLLTTAPRCEALSVAFAFSIRACGRLECPYVHYVTMLIGPEITMTMLPNLDVTIWLIMLLMSLTAKLSLLSWAEPVGGPCLMATMMTLVLP